MNRVLLRNLIEDILIDNYKRTLKFSPTFIADILNVDLDDTVSILEGLVNDGLLFKVFVVRCEECHYIFEYENYNDIPLNKFEECKLGHVSLITNDDIQIWYKLNKEDIKEIKDYKKTVCLKSHIKQEPTYLKQLLPHTKCVVINGDVNMNNNNNISDSFNHSILDNNNIQSTINENNPLVSKQQVDELEECIHQIDEEDIRQMNEEFLENFKTSLQEHDKETARKWIGYINNTLNSPIVQTIIGALN
ncbi:hypothetical protein K9E77_11905 [Staphylococcus pseudintermedius]|nr:hypothetical protein K9E77_11905 [Staphylococcus pseudintermedius]